MPAMTTIQDAARVAYDSFESATRDDGSIFIRTKEGSPEWVTDMLHAAHGDFLPDDYRYRWTMEACEVIADLDDTDLDDAASEFADNVDVYTSNLLDWVSSNLQRVGYADEAAEEHGDDTIDITSRIMLGQYAERREVFESVLEFLNGYTH